MKGQMKTGRRMITVLLASAALGLAPMSFAQMSSMSAPVQRPQGNSDQNPSTQQAAPVGPGTVNYVEGQVSLDGQALSLHSIGVTALHTGESLTTGQGYAELLLTPGAFLRVGNNSEVRLTEAGLAATTVEFVRGSGMLEVDQLIKGTHLGVTLGQATIQIQKKGLYNFDGAQKAVRVLDGEAKVTLGGHDKTLGKNDQLLLVSNKPLKRRDFNAKSVKTEPLYVWSEARSQDESEASMAAASNPEGYSAAGPGWYWDQYAGDYGFWPFDSYLYSPFGFGFYSPAYFGYYGGFGGGGYGWYGHSGWYGHPGWHGGPGGWHGHVGGVSARPSGFGGFHGGGGGGGFHGGGGGFHGGGGGHR